MNGIQWYTFIVLTIFSVLIFIEADDAMSGRRVGALEAFTPGMVVVALLFPIIGRVFNWW